MPDTTGLYGKYVLWGIIDPNEANGGWHPYLRGGLTYDTRNQQQNPSKGIYTDAFLTYTAAFADMKEYNNLKLNFNFRHYLPITDNISFAYRVGTQLNLLGKSPFYLNSYMNTMFIQRVIYEGLGGGNSLRGIVRNRILSNGFAFANLELRLKLWKFKIGKENFYVGINPLFDAGMVLQPYDLDRDEIVNNIEKNDPSFNLNNLDEYFDFDESLIYKPHLSAGIGLKVAMNENFILSVDWELSSFCFLSCLKQVRTGSNLPIWRCQSCPRTVININLPRSYGLSYLSISDSWWLPVWLSGQQECRSLMLSIIRSVSLQPEASVPGIFQ